jgi:lysophospholipase L1-like esterase
LIGDSISLGYEPLVRKRLAGLATVVHPLENCRSTIHGLAKIDTWLGDGSWDVIHFNWGIWDAHHLAGNRFRTTPEEYEQNLRKLVSRLKATGAKLIWASSTPITGRVAQGGIWVEGSEIPLRNRIAQKVMEQNGIVVNDLFAEILPQAEEFHREDRCHFTPEGYDFLARYVAESIEGVLNIPAEQVP